MNSREKNPKKQEVAAIRDEAERYIKLRLDNQYGTVTSEEIEILFNTLKNIDKTSSYGDKAKEIQKIKRLSVLDNTINEADSRKIAALLGIYTTATEYLEKADDTKYTQLQENISKATQDLCQSTHKYDNPENYVKTIAIISQLSKISRRGISNIELLDKYQQDAVDALYQKTKASYAQLKQSTAIIEELSIALPVFAQNLKEITDQLTKAKDTQAEQQKLKESAQAAGNYYINTHEIDNTVRTLEEKKAELTQMVHTLTNTLLNKLSDERDEKDENLEESMLPIIHSLTDILGLETISRLLRKSPNQHAKHLALYLLEYHFKERSLNPNLVEELIDTYASTDTADFAKLYAVFSHPTLRTQQRGVMASVLLYNARMVNWLLENNQQEAYAAVIQAHKKNSRERSLHYYLSELFEHWTDENFKEVLKKEPLLKDYLEQSHDIKEVVSSIIDNQDTEQRFASLAMLAAITRNNYEQIDIAKAGLGNQKPILDSKKLEAILQHLINSLLLENAMENIERLMTIIGRGSISKLLKNHPDLKIKKLFSFHLLKHHIETSPLPDLDFIQKQVAMYLEYSPTIADISNLYAVFTDIGKFFPENRAFVYIAKEEFPVALASAFLQKKSIVNWLLDENHANEYKTIMENINTYFINHPKKINVGKLFASWTKEDFQKALAIHPDYLLIQYGMLRNNEVVNSLTDAKLEIYVKALDITPLSDRKIKHLDKRVRIAYLKNIDSWKRLGEDENILRARLDSLVHDFDEADIEKLKNSEYGLIASFKKHPNAVTKVIIDNHKRAIGWQLLETLDTGFLRKELEEQLHHDLESEWEAKWIYNLRHQLVVESFYNAGNDDAYPFSDNRLVKRDLEINPKKFAQHAECKARKFVLMHYPNIINLIATKTSRRPFKNCLDIYLEKAGTQGISANLLLTTINRLQTYAKGTSERTAGDALLKSVPSFLGCTQQFESEHTKILFDLYQLYRSNYPVSQGEPVDVYNNDPIIIGLTSRLSYESEKETNIKRREFLGTICFQDPILFAGYIDRNKDKTPRESKIATYLRTFTYGAATGLIVGAVGSLSKQLSGFFNVQFSLFQQQESVTLKILSIVKIITVGATTAVVGASTSGAIAAFAVLVVAGSATAGLLFVAGRAVTGTLFGWVKNSAANKWHRLKTFLGYDITETPVQDRDFLRGFLRSIQSEEDKAKFRNMMLHPDNKEIRMNFAKTLGHTADNNYGIKTNEPGVDKDVLRLALHVQKEYQFQACTTSEKIVSGIGDIPKTILSIIMSPLTLLGINTDWCRPAWLSRLVHNRIERALLREINAQEDSKQEADTRKRKRPSTTVELMQLKDQQVQPTSVNSLEPVKYPVTKSLFNTPTRIRKDSSPKPSDTHKHPKPHQLNK